MPNFYICSICKKQKRYGKQRVAATLTQVPGYRPKHSPPQTHGTVDQVSLICPSCEKKQQPPPLTEMETISIQRVEGGYRVERIS